MVSNTLLPLQLTLNLLGRFFPELATFGSFARVVRDAGCVGGAENFVSLLFSQAAPPSGYLFQLLSSPWSELLLLRGKGQSTSNKKKKIKLDKKKIKLDSSLLRHSNTRGNTFPNASAIFLIP
ncbi:PREDICTED: uncharacterized protein LOC105143688 [Acromyrmex echinatior]|uniref:uncharacterized protein LOC105143688 n=1 Tax=Acromyrmex echinatior TaxID=103372 RepID=UPI000580E00C|nr:PREDICTED: uncharacterized protein LOC105143688 [Acromyrmex echinatior]